MSKDDWRNDDSLLRTSKYKKRFAILPRKCADGTSVWLKTYYSKYYMWSANYGSKVFRGEHCHTDFIENITEAEYLVRKLAEDL